MDERYAVVFRVDGSGATGRLEIEQDRLRLCGRGQGGTLELEIPFADLTEIHIGRRPDERLNGYRTLVLERGAMSAVRVAPIGMGLLPEIAGLLASLSHTAESEFFAVLVPLKPGCLNRARKLLAKGPPLDPSTLGLDSHEVYLRGAEALFVFRGSNVRSRVNRAIRHPAVWRAGLAWQGCFAAPPREVDAADLNFDCEPAFRWVASGVQVPA